MADRCCICMTQTVLMADGPWCRSCDAEMPGPVLALAAAEYGQDWT